MEIGLLVSDIYRHMAVGFGQKGTVKRKREIKEVN